MSNALFAIPGLMTPHAPNFQSQLIAPENGSIVLLLHSGKEGDVVNYCINVGQGYRRHGVIKDPGYHYVNGMDGREQDIMRSHRGPQFQYVTRILPDDTLIPKVNAHGCPIPITELNKDINPVYYILRLPATGLPIGDTQVEVVVNGRLRTYIVHRPDFGVHSRRDISMMYNKLANTPEGMFEAEACSNNDSILTIDVHKHVDPNIIYVVFLRNEKRMVDLDFFWSEDNKHLKAIIPAGLPQEKFELVASWSRDDEHWEKLVSGFICVHEYKYKLPEQTILVPGELNYDIDTYDISDSVKERGQFRLILDKIGVDPIYINGLLTGNTLHFNITEALMAGVYDVKLQFSIFPNSWSTFGIGELKINLP